MCITLGAAELYKTIIAGWKIGDWTYMVYTNMPQNLSGKKNAMILPFPGLKTPLTIDNIVSVPGELLVAIAEYQKEATRGLSSDSEWINKKFSDGVYEYISTTPAELIFNGYREFGEFYARLYGENITLLACEFIDPQISNPPDLMVRYVNEEMDMFFPLLDCHTREVPDIDHFEDSIHQLLILGLNEKQTGAISREDVLRENPKMQVLREHLPPYFRLMEPHIVDRYIKSEVGNKQKDLFVGFRERGMRIHEYAG